QTHVPQAERKIVFDVFHILQHMNTAVDKVRRAEHRLLRAPGDDTLTGSKYVWLYGEENVPDHHQERITELTRRRSRKPLETARAWPRKEMLRARSLPRYDPLSRPRISLDTSLGGMMLLQGGGHEQTQARPEVRGQRRGGGERAS